MKNFCSYRAHRDVKCDKLQLILLSFFHFLNSPRTGHYARAEQICMENLSSYRVHKILKILTLFTSDCNTSTSDEKVR